MKAFKLFLIITGFLILVIGRRMYFVDHKFKEQLYLDSLAYYQKTLNLLLEDSINRRNLFKNSTPPQALIELQSDMAEPYLNASQGVEVMLKGLEWNGKIVEEVYPQLRQHFNARYIINHNQLELDPDFPDCGYPNLHILIPEVPTPLMENKELLPRSLRRKMSKNKPIESFNLTVNDTTKVRMDLWLANFEIVFRIFPDQNHRRNEESSFEGRHPITGMEADHIRRQREFKDQRYSNMTLFLEFKPKNSWYIAEGDKNGFFSTDKQPQIGIAAVEAIKIYKVGEDGMNNNDQRIALSIENGMSLPLYNSLSELQDRFTGQYLAQELTREVDHVGKLYYDLVASSDLGTVFNRDLFGKSKFSAVQIKNLGSWKNKEDGWLFSGAKYEADLFRANFLLHLFVIGEWTVKPQSFIPTELKKPVVVRKPGLWDILLPDFKLGFIGKFFSGIVIFSILFVILGTFVGPIGKILDLVIGTILKVVGDRNG